MRVLSQMFAEPVEDSKPAPAGHTPGTWRLPDNSRGPPSLGLRFMILDSMFMVLWYFYNTGELQPRLWPWSQRSCKVRGWH